MSSDTWRRHRGRASHGKPLGRPDERAFETHDRVRQIDVARTDGGAIELRVAAPDAIAVVEDLPAVGAAGVTGIEDAKECLVDRGRAEIPGVHAGDGARGVAGAASDA